MMSLLVISAIPNRLKKTGASTTVSVTNKLNYDHHNRLTRITVQHNNSAEQVIAQYEYNELGQLKDRKLHQKTDGSFLQSLDYRYNVRGWLTHINNSKLVVDGETNDDNNDIFGFEILYNQKENGLENDRYYNGKISAIKWQSKVASPVTGNPQRERSYRFSYDGADRLLKASYVARSSTGWNAEQNGYNEEVGGYDHNGNILSLFRNTWDHNATTATLIDHLVYGYKAGSGNQLAKVNDSSGDSRGFNNLSDSAEEYSYDGNGNLTGDANKQISISYNELNKTSRVDYSDGKYVSYDYDALGARIRKTVHHPAAGTPTTIYDYIEGFVYENGTLSYYATAEGRVRIGTAAKFEYFIKDHLGNVRASFEEQGGRAAIIQENHYYPFGMTMRGVVEQLAAVISGSNKQLYNGGAELQDDFMAEHSYSTWYREYDPVLGRFNAIDPMADQYMSWSPYNYAFNDPVGMNDPFGDSPPGRISNPGFPEATWRAIEDAWNQTQQFSNMHFSDYSNGRWNYQSVIEVSEQDGSYGYYSYQGIEFFNEEHSGVYDEKGNYLGTARHVFKFVKIDAQISSMAVESGRGANSGGVQEYFHNNNGEISVSALLSAS